jgi:hypothetical protein
MGDGKRASGFLIPEIGKQQIPCPGNEQKNIGRMEPAKIFGVNGVGNEDMAAPFLR